MFNYIGEDEAVISMVSKGNSMRRTKSQLVEEISELRRQLAALKSEMAEKAYSESQRLLEHAQEMAHLGSWKVDFEKNSVTWSDEFHRMIGLARSEFDGSRDTFLKYVHPEDRERIARQNEDLAKGKDLNYTLRLLRPDGQEFIGHVRGEVTSVVDGVPRQARGIIQDITKLKASENALRESEARLTEAQEIAHLGAWEWNHDTGEFVWSDEVYRIFGVDKETFRVSNDAFYACVHPQDREFVQEAVRRGNAGGVPYEYEHRILRPDGEVRTVYERTVPHPASAGKLHREHGIIQDITERKRAEDIIRASEQRIRLITDNLPALITYVDLERRYRFVNRTFEEWTATSASNVIGRTMEEVLGSETNAEISAFAARALQGEYVSYECDMPYATEERTVSAEMVPDIGDDGKVRGYYGLAHDITERKAAEEALRESEARLNVAQRIAHIGSWEYNERTDKLVWSDEVYRIFGVSKGEHQTTRENGLKLVHPDDRSIMVEARIRAAKGETDYSYEYRIVRPDGEVRILRNVVLVIAREGDGALRRAGTVQDITEQVRTEEHLRQAQKMEAVGQLTGGLAHDFNNLLTVILGNLELIRDRMDIDTAGDEMIERGVKAAERGAALTHRLLAFSRKQTLLPTSVDVGKLVAGMVDMLRRTLGETIELRSSKAGSSWLCHADKSQLESALLNLSINSRDAMPNGGHLTIETANISLNDEFAAAQADVEPGDYVMLAVSDTGIGIDSDTLKHVFEPFFTTKEVGEGSGLGLSMVYGFAKQSGGTATIYSEPGIGTTVKIYLPRSTSHVGSAAPSPTTSAIPRAKGEHILIVEDDADVRTLAVAVLSGLGYGISEAGSAEEALAVMQYGAHIDLLLSDVVLPGALNGPGLAAEIQRRSQTTKTVFMTGYAEEAFNNHIELEERTNVIQKPFKKADLANIIRSVLDDVCTPGSIRRSECHVIYECSWAHDGQIWAC